MDFNKITNFIFDNKIIILLIGAYIVYTKMIDPTYIIGIILIYYCYMISYNMEKIQTDIKILKKNSKKNFE
jgi:hypothetical protein